MKAKLVKENLNESKIIKNLKYYHLYESQDGRFHDQTPIALIDINTTKKERIELADEFTNGNFSKYSGFYLLDGPFKTPPILSK